jgi:hypothetical protein
MPVLTFIEFDQAENVTNRRHAQLMRESLRFGMVKHVNKRMWDHFGDNPKTAPGGAYGYRPRNPKYIKAKVRRFGAAAAGPNIRTHRMRKYIRDNAMGRITATQHRARVRMSSYFPMTDERRREMEAIAPQERIEITNDVRGEYVRLINDPSNRRLRRRKRI